MNENPTHAYRILWAWISGGLFIRLKSCFRNNRVRHSDLFIASFSSDSETFERCATEGEEYPKTAVFIPLSHAKYE